MSKEGNWNYKNFNDYERNEEEESQLGKKTAARFNKGKTRFDLIPLWPLEQLGLIYTYGCSKYDDNNWWKGLKWKAEVLGCVYRHLFKWLRGERFDDESGLHHLSHCVWNLFTLMEYERAGIGIDDRIPYELDLLPPEEQKLKIKAWKELTSNGEENKYNGLNYIKE